MGHLDSQLDNYSGSLFLGSRFLHFQVRRGACLMLGHLINILNLIFPNNFDSYMWVFRVKTILPDICGGFSGGEEGETNCGLASLRGGGILPCHLTTPIHHPNIPTSHHPHPTTPTSHYVPSFDLHHYH